jgi:uncharacterized protein
MDVTAELIFLSFLLGLGAVLYTSVGHGGASAYIAIMALFGLSADVIRPTALTLNILVSSFASFRFIKAGFFNLKSFIPIAIGAIPAAFIGGYLKIPAVYYQVIVGLILLYAASRFLMTRPIEKEEAAKGVPFWGGVLAGGLIGFLSGLTGTGGGIFLSPLLLFLNWTTTRVTSGVAAMFILVNSSAGLLGNISSVKNLPAEILFFAPAVLLGAVIGTSLGTKRLNYVWLRRGLGLVLVIAGLKLLLT